MGGKYGRMSTRMRWQRIVGGLGLLAVLLSSMGDVSAPVRAQSPDGTIPLLSRVVGIVEDVDGNPLEGIDVAVRAYGYFDEPPPPVAGVTDLEGEFSVDVDFTPPDGGGYQVVFSDPADVYGKQVTEPIFLQPGYDQVIGITMAEGGRVVGAVTSAGGALSDVCVDVYRYGDDDSILVGSSCSGPDGSYDTGALDAGVYSLVAFEDGYFEAFETVEVVSGISTTVDLDLMPRTGTGSASVTVDVVSADNGEPVPSCVSVFGGQNSQYSCNDSGAVTVVGLEPGSYQVYVSPTDGRHLPTSAIATLVEGGNQLVVNAALGGVIEGTVTGVDGTTPISGVRVQLCSIYFGCSSGIFGGDPSTFTGVSGQYRFEGLNPGSQYVVRFSALGYSTQFWDGTPETDPAASYQDGALVQVPVGVLAGIDARMVEVELVSISGSVVDSVSSLGIANATVRVRRDAGGYLQTVAVASTGPDGSYTTSPLEAGEYQVSVAAIGYVSERFDDVKNGSGVVTPVVVAPGSPPPEVSFELDPQGILQGNVTTDLPPVGDYQFGRPSYCVTATPANVEFAAVSDCARIGEAYRLAKLPAGEYTVRVSSSDYVTQDGIALVVASVLGGDTKTLDFSLVRKPVISGTIVDAAAQPAANATVCVYGGASVFGSCGYTQGDGTYSVVVDEPGTYEVRAEGYQYVTKWYPDLVEAPAAPNVVVDAAGATGIDFTLDRLPQVTIVAVDESGQPACGIPVNVFDNADTPVLSTRLYCFSTPDATSTFFIEPGTYRLGFGGSSWFAAAEYEEEYWENQPSLASADEVVLGLNTASNFAVAVAALPELTGVVTTDAAGNAPLSNVYVQVYPSDHAAQFSPPLFGTFTGFDGTYRLPLPQGSYKVRFQRFGYVEEWWDNAEDLAEAADVVVTSSGSVANASLEPLIQVSGRVTVAGSATPVSNAYVEFWQGDTTVAWAVTSFDGTYSAFVRPGSYDVFFSRSGFAGEWFDDVSSRTSATPVVVSDAVTGVDAALTAYPRISGTVVDEATGLPIQGVVVRARFGSGQQVAAAFTDSAGNYSVGAPPAEVVLEFDGRSAGYVSEFFDDADDFDTAALIDLRSGDQVVNVSLPIGGAISGTLRDESGAVSSGCVYAYPDLESGAGLSGVDCAGSDGIYRISGLRDGDYDVVWFGSSTVWYDGVGDRSSATAVSVVAGTEQTGIDLSVPAGRVLSGVVTDEGGGPIAGARVEALGSVFRSALTGDDGSFAINLPDAVASYQVRFTAEGYVSEFFDDARTYDAPGYSQVSIDSVDVDLGQIDLAAVSVNVSGTIVESGTTTRVSRACAEFYELNGFSYWTCADETGQYSIDLPAEGSYRVWVYDSNSPGRYLADFPFDFASPLVVGTTDLIQDFSMERGYRASGRVVVEGTTVGLPGVQVWLYDAVTGRSAFGWTDLNGSFTTGPVPPGSYSVQFSNSNGRYITEYLGGGFASPGDPLLIVDADVDGVDAALAAGAIVSGIVSDQESNPVGGACVTARFAGSPDVLSASCTNSDGRYATPGLPDGSIELSVDASGFPVFTTVVDIVGGIDQTLDVTLQPGVVPGLVENLVATPRVGGVTLTWDPPSNPTGVVDYTVLLLDEGGIYQEYATSADTSLVVSGLPGGVLQSFAVRTSYSDASVGPEAYISATPLSVSTSVDFDGNGAADRSIFRPSVGGWYVENQPTVFIGLADDVPVPADYDGDGVVEQAVFRDGVWYIEGQPTQFLGLAGDIPVPADYDGDGVSEVAVFRSGVWYIDGQPAAYFGSDGDIPVPADYNGDGTVDRAVYRPSVGGWYVEGLPTEFFGLPSDVPVPADYDGDGVADRAVYRPEFGGWYVQGQDPVFLGLSEDVPVPADYDGDGVAERAVYRPQFGGWYVEGQATTFYGLGSDVPLPLPASVYRRFYSPTA